MRPRSPPHPDKHWPRRPGQICAREQPLRTPTSRPARWRRPYVVANLYPQKGIVGDDDIDPGAEFNEAHPLSPFHSVARLEIEDDASRQQAGYLFEDNLDALVLALSPHRDHVLLVSIGRVRVHGVQIQAFLVVDPAQNSADRRAIYVHVEYAQEDTDALALAIRGLNQRCFSHFAVTW